MSQVDVIVALGPPQDESIAREPKTFKYGGLQITLTRRQPSADPAVTLIALYFGPHVEPIPEPARPKDFTATAETTIAGFRELLSRVGLKESACVEGEETGYLIMPSGARVTFDGPQLNSIMFTVRAPAPHKKQISVSIPESLATVAHAGPAVEPIGRRIVRSVDRSTGRRRTGRLRDERAALWAIATRENS
jgi:hypothetical protein